MQQTRQKWPYSVDPESLAGNTGTNSSQVWELNQFSPRVAWPGPVYALNIPPPAGSICLFGTSGQG